ncbi:hypothetical protein [Cytobacillus firmus]|uniref:hypothetical protein n=1 Tax=Cytobacillus firmus TaxID=1399 RepID=UPI0018CEE7F8|nr:hypothetical protein [Cytobacillus firmus]MBG9587212.1 hypothetical protein [Cytobacillus firmus]
MENIYLIFLLILGSILSILSGNFLWKKGDSRESFWEALLDGVFSIYSLFPFFIPDNHYSFRSLAVSLWIFGFIMILIIVFLLI